MMMKENKLLLWHNLFWVEFEGSRNTMSYEKENVEQNFEQVFAWRERHQLDVKYLKDNGNRSTGLL